MWRGNRLERSRDDLAAKPGPDLARTQLFKLRHRDRRRDSYFKWAPPHFLASLWTPNPDLGQLAPKLLQKALGATTLAHRSVMTARIAVH